MSHYKNIVNFTLPMSYSFHTRYIGKTGIAAWIIKYFVPVAVLAFGHEEFAIVDFFVGLLYLYGIYEIGYIQNDCETIKQETNPTMRLETSELAFYERHKYCIYTVRILTVVAIYTILYMRGISTSLLGYGGTMTFVVFLLYNRIRSGLCLLVHLALMMLRYSVPIFIAIDGFCPVCLVMILFIYPITLFIERSVKGKFGYRNKFFARFLMNTYDDRYVFRVRYYAVMILCCLVLVYYGVIPAIYNIPVVLLLLTSVQNSYSDKLHYNK